MRKLALGADAGPRLGMRAYCAAACALALLVLPAAHGQSGLHVLNQYSYSEEGEEWSVMFEAPAGQLSISGAGGTQVGRDVSFTRLGGLAPSTSGETMTFAWGGGSGELVVSVLEPGMHELLFESAGVQARAYNDAYPSTAKMIGGAAGGPRVLAGDQFGTSVANIGDVDGDGVPDIAAGFPFRSANAGTVYVILMNGDGTAKESSALFVRGVAAGDQFGNAVAGIGDVDGDGVPDIAVGSPKKSQGQVRVITLNADGTTKSLGAAISAPLSARSGAEFGASVAGIGDVDGDGIPDIAAGSPNARSVTGAAHVVLLRADGSARQTVEVRAGSNQLFGSSVSGIGDFDRDGVPDLVVGSPGNARNTGAVHVVRLNADGSAKESSSIGGAPFGTGLRFGTSVSGVGDLDGDGIPDIVAGVPQASPGGNGRGAAHVIYLAASGGIKSSYQIDGTSPHMPPMANFDLFGRAVAGLGDLDRDGAFELAVGAPGDDGTGLDAGALYVIRLDRAAPAGSGELREIARVGNDSTRLSLTGAGEFGYSVAAIGDIDGDGVPDMAVGARYDDAGGGDRGAVYVLIMEPDGSIDEITKIASETGGGPTLADGDRFGSGVAGIGDADGDGIPDIAVGASNTDGAEFSEGAVYLLLLNRDGTAKSHSKIDGSTARGPTLHRFDYFGDSISSADLDSDGAADLAVGAPAFTGNGNGSVHVLLMNADRSVKSSLVIDGNSVALSPDDRFGRSVSFVGDLDGDGVPDLAAGSTLDDDGGSNRGAVHVLLMNSDGTVKTAREVNSGTAGGPVLLDGDWFGSGISGTGDLDGDGVPDIVAGAVGDDGSGRNTGVLHLLYMNSDATLKGSSEVPSSSSGSVTASDFGWSVASADINGDGQMDLAVGSPGTDSDAGDAHVLLMSGTSVSASVALSESAPDLPASAASMLGTAVSGIGDLDRDGVPDLAVGTPDNYGVHMVLMNEDGAADRTITIYGNNPDIAVPNNGRFGDAVAGVGDLDRDGIPDVGVGSPGVFGGGGVFIVFMNRDGMESVSGITRLSTNGPRLVTGDDFGSAVAGIGDIDGNGVPDMAVGAPLADSASSADQGTVFIMLMDHGTDGLSWNMIRVPRDHALTLSAGDMLGSAVAGIGDIDGNGVPDVAVGAPGDDGRSSSDAQRGEIHVLLMSSTGVHSSTRIGDGVGGGPLMSGDYLFGSSVSGIGDLDRDGVPDVAVGAPGISSDEGGGYVLLMNADGSARQAVQVSGALGLSAGDMFGSSVSLLGDLNGDGAVEIAVGAPRHDDEGNDNKGTVRVMSGFRPAVVTGVDSPTPDNTYGIGDDVDITVEFSEPVSVTGTPRLLLETGRSDGHAGYSSGSGTDELSFEYTVREGDVSADLGYVSISSLSASGGSVAWSDRATSLDLPRPGTRDSLSFSKALQIDGVRPEIHGTVALDLSLGTLTIEFDEEIDASEIDAGGIVLHSGGSRTSLAGAALPASDSRTTVIRLTGEQTREIIGAYLAAMPVRMDVSSSAFQDTVGNHFAGVSGMTTSTSLTLAADSPTFSDQARSYKSGYIPYDQPTASDSASERADYVRTTSDSPTLSDQARSYKSGSVSPDSPDASDSASSRADYVRTTSGSSSHSDSARSYKSELVGVDSPGLSDSAAAYKSGTMASDSPATSDSAMSHKSGALVLDAPAFSDSASHARASVSSSSDTATVSDSASSYKSGSLGADSPSLSDSARSYRSGALFSDLPSLSDSVRIQSASVRSSSDTATVSDSARSYKSGSLGADSPSLYDSASLENALARVSSDTAVFSDSATARKSSSTLSDSPSLSDSASLENALARVSSDTAVFSDSASAHKSGSLRMDSPSLSDSARAHKSAHLVSDSPAMRDSASSNNMLQGSLSDAPPVSDSARSYKSAVHTSDSPMPSDSASRAEMLVTGSSDTAAFSDSARSYKSGALMSDAPALTDSASYNNMLVQGISDTASVSDSARSHQSGVVLSDAPALADSTMGLGALASGHADALLPSDSADAYKSASMQQSLPALLDQLQWGSMRAASVSDSPDVGDSAGAHKSSTTVGDAPAHYGEVRAGKTAMFESDAPRVSDAALTGRLPVEAADALDVSDAVGFYVDMLEQKDPQYVAPSPTDRAGSGDTPIPAERDRAPDVSLNKGSGSVGVATVSIHGASWDTCSPDPHVLVVAGPDCASLDVTFSSGVVATQLAGVAGAPPDSCVWRAPVNPDIQKVQIRAVHGRTAIHDDRTLVMDSCSGWAPFTPFAVRAGPPVAAPVVAPVTTAPDLLPASDSSAAALEPDGRADQSLDASKNEVAAPETNRPADTQPPTTSSPLEESAEIPTEPSYNRAYLVVEPTALEAPPERAENPDMVWVVIATVALVAVIGLAAFRSRRTA